MKYNQNWVDVRFVSIVSEKLAENIIDCISKTVRRLYGQPTFGVASVKLLLNVALFVYYKVSHEHCKNCVKLCKCWQ